MNLSIYMFHAIGEIDEDDWADKHYGYSEEKFYTFLNQVGKVQSFEQAISSRNDLPVLTFDDGHTSNYDVAKKLYEKDLGFADFFINPEKVGEPYYLTWTQIKEMSNWGMSIQSHGLDHQYMSDLSIVEQEKQLKLSKEIIEQNLDNNVTIFAPPGGRFDSDTVSLSKSLNYKSILSSRPGKNTSFDKYVFNRITVLSHMTVNDLLDFHRIFSIKQFKYFLKYYGLKIVKTMLGNDRYDRFRNIVLGD